MPGTSTTQRGLTQALGAMPTIQAIVKTTISFIAGLALACLGVIILTAVASGDARVGAGVASFAGVSFIAIAAPCLAYPFWPRLAAVLVAFDLVAFGVAMLWLAFRADGPSGPSIMFQAAAGAFCIILLLRFSLAYRRRKRVRGA